MKLNCKYSKNYMHNLKKKYLFQCMAFAMALVVSAEPPSGYSYNKPSGGGGGFVGGGGSGFGVSGGGGGYTAVSSGYQTSEGQNVDPQLLEQIRQILLKEEQQSGGGHGGGFGGGHAPSSSYGVPSSSYGVPSYATKVVGIDLDGVRQAIQVAQYHQVSQGHVGGGGGYPSGPSGGYPARVPSGSYGAPF